MSKFFSQKYSSLSPYVPGEQPKEREYVKLNTNESPFPPSEKAIKFVCEQAQKLYLYPDPDLNDLTNALSKYYGVNRQNVIVTNGSDEVLNFAFMAYCDSKTPAVFPDITYGFYKVFAEINNVDYKIVPLKQDFSVDVDGLVAQKGTIFIANPNAPTGLNLTLDQIERIVSSDLNRVVVVDEAYVDFGGQSALSLIEKYDNLLVTQTFSKSRSMAGARLGVGLAGKEIISDLVTIKYSTNPYNVNRMTASAGIGSIMDDEYFKNNCKAIIDNRDFVTSELKKLGFSLTDSKANFVFAKHEDIDGEQLYIKLKQKGVLVRHFTNDRIKDYNRITVGSREQMQKLVTAVKEILEDK